jgi:hypothetical protein
LRLGENRHLNKEAYRSQRRKGAKAPPFISHRNCAMTEEQDNPNEPSRDHERLIADAVAAYHDLRLQGEAINADEYCRDYPELDPELRAQLMALDEIDMALMPRVARGSRGWPWVLFFPVTPRDPRG